jgi:hypothetical protein
MHPDEGLLRCVSVDGDDDENRWEGEHNAVPACDTRWQSRTPACRQRKAEGVS